MEMDGKADVQPLPAQFPVTAEVLTLVAGMDELKGAWQAIGRLAPERLSSLRRNVKVE
jgi:hypothetical protein